jgi:hypothetical protein
MRLASPTRLVLLRVIASEKKVQGNKAAKAKMGYGRPSEGTLTNRPNITAKIPMVKSGWKIAHATPKAVCLYRTFTSRQIKK